LRPVEVVGIASDGKIACRRLNLLNPFTNIGPFDIILCRNAAIYFNPMARKSLFERLTRELTLEGYRFVGSAEPGLSRM
jgi:chemotaxis protein methyltransferase CheR